MELAWQFGMPVTELMERIPSYEVAWWKALARIRHEEQEEMRLKAKRGGRRGSSFQGENDRPAVMGQR